MPLIVQDLIAEKPRVVVTTPDEPVRDALQRMIKHDYSQLPVVDEDNRPKSMLTSESILRALTSFESDLDQLHVEHATAVVAPTFRDDADLFELLDRLQDTYAVLIVDGEDKLIGIVTNYDTAEFFRRRAEDIMLVEDIETMLKDYIQATFTDESGELDEEHLDQAVQRITDTGKAQRQQFERALIHYLTLQGDNSDAKPNADWLQQVYTQHFSAEQPAKEFDDLTLYEYIELLLDKSRWSNYRSIFNLNNNSLRNLLTKVRTIRNALAHFRGEISAAERDLLRFSANWLAQYQDAIASLYLPARESIAAKVLAEPQQEYEVQVEESVNVDDMAFLAPLEDEAEPRDSRYAPLAIWLQNRPSKESIVQLTFEGVEEIIGGKLPGSAHDHRAWWANDSVGHVQSQQWLEVGWKVTYINMTEGTVRFSRMKERQKAYNHFYSGLLSKLRQQPEFENAGASPSSKYWQHIESLSVSDVYFAALSYSFRRGGIFRVELYIDTKECKRNKRIYDGLYKRRGEIETAFGSELLWQRLDDSRASRIAVSCPGSITDESTDLDALQDWGVETLTAFSGAIRRPAQEEAERSFHKSAGQ